jgi:hypothetical protein
VQSKGYFLNGGKERGGWNGGLCTFPVMNYEWRAVTTFFFLYSRYRGEFLDVVPSSIKYRDKSHNADSISVVHSSEWITATSGTLLFGISPSDRHEDVLTKRPRPESNAWKPQYSWNWHFTFLWSDFERIIDCDLQNFKVTVTSDTRVA